MLIRKCNKCREDIKEYSKYYKISSSAILSDIHLNREYPLVTVDACTSCFRLYLLHWLGMTQRDIEALFAGEDAEGEWGT